MAHRKRHTPEQITSILRQQEAGLFYISMKIHVCNRPLPDLSKSLAQGQLLFKAQIDTDTGQDAGHRNRSPSDYVFRSVRDFQSQE